MGQYYKPANIDKKEWLYSHDFGNGLKLMEHSYLRNNFVQAVETLLTEFGPWYKNRIIWAGDYADPEDKSREESDDNKNIYFLLDEEAGVEPLAPYEIDKLRKVHSINLGQYRYIVNHSLKQFVDKKKVKAKKDRWKVHPLPLLTAEGNGRGGGDYYEGSPDIHLVGYWARCSISMEKTPPEGYEELIVNFQI